MISHSASKACTMFSLLYLLSIVLSDLLLKKPMYLCVKRKKSQPVHLPCRITHYHYCHLSRHQFLHNKTRYFIACSCYKRWSFP